jgi:hypothetical protein
VLDRYDIEVSLTASQRVGMHQYAFREGGDAHVVIDLEERYRRPACWNLYTPGKWNYRWRISFLARMGAGPADLFYCRVFKTDEGFWSIWGHRIERRRSI